MFPRMTTGGGPGPTQKGAAKVRAPRRHKVLPHVAAGVGPGAYEKWRADRAIALAQKDPQRTGFHQADIRNPVAVQVRHDDRPWRHEDVAERLLFRKSSLAVAQVNDHTPALSLCDDQIQVAVAVYIRQHDPRRVAERFLAGCDCALGESAVLVVEPDVYGAGVVPVGEHQVRPAIAVQVAGDQISKQA